MSVGILPFVEDTRSIDEFYADQAAERRAREIALARPQMGAVADVLARTLPGWRQLPEAVRLDIAFEIVNAVDVGF
jgi:hypothetical protein